MFCCSAQKSDLIVSYGSWKIGLKKTLTRRYKNTVSSSCRASQHLNRAASDRWNSLEIDIEPAVHIGGLTLGVVCNT